ncbi:MAG: hypothetical protein NTW16_17545 [Bacteroidetes bacterium]|nr:hypothetical protein [Bacteroidota bacterium]
MKKTSLFLLTAIVLGCTLVAHSTVLRVNNTPSITVPYATLAAAYDAAVDGDTIYIEASGFGYGSFSCYKRLVFIGSGYYLNENPETQASINVSTIASLNFYGGSAGSKVMGLYISSGMYLVGNAQNMVFIRNYIGSIGGSAENSLFEQNWINSFSGTYENTIIKNNMVNDISIRSYNNSLVVSNNVINYANLNLVTQCTNNIIYGTCTFTNCNVLYNVCSATQAPAGNGNQLNVNMNDVFMCYGTCTGYSTDARYQLKAGSPAIGAGANGEDCGMFGGPNPYILSGMPAIPAIYNFNYYFNDATIHVDMKVKSHN